MPDDKNLNLSPKPSDRIAKTTCYMCACRCGINVHMKGDEIRYIEGNRDHPVNQGVLCAKGSGRHYAASIASTSAVTA
jgi:anaerobic selenocysteine-containing dehydrogenase